MRNALFVLLLLNFLAFGYQHWVLVPDEGVDAFYLEQEVPGLRLLSRPAPAPADSELELLDIDVAEADVATVSLTGDSNAAPEEPEDSDRCLRIGPFSRIADAAEVRDVLEAREMLVSQVTEEGQVWMGHWVQVVGLSDAKAADKARNTLINGGITDVYVLPDDADNRISLGVFRLRSSANTLVKQAQGLGLKTRVDDRFQPGSNHWLRVRMAGDGSLQAGEFKGDAGQIVRTEDLECPAQGI